MCRHRPCEWPAALCPTDAGDRRRPAAALSNPWVTLSFSSPPSATLRTHSPSYPAYASSLTPVASWLHRRPASIASRSTTDEDEIEFRDGIHGLLVWALAVAWAPCWRQRQRVPWPRPRRCLQACQTRRPTSRSLPTTLTGCCAASKLRPLPSYRRAEAARILMRASASAALALCSRGHCGRRRLLARARPAPAGGHFHATATGCDRGARRAGHQAT
jgi:hypothetical protein